MFVIVTQCFHPVVGGIENLMTELADNLAASGFSVRVFADNIKDNKNKKELEKPYPIERFGGVKFFRRWKKFRALSVFLKKNKISGIFADSWKSVEALPKLRNVPIVVLAHGMEYPENASQSKRLRITEALSRCDTIVANSRYTADLVRKVAAVTSNLVIINPAVKALTAPSEAAIASIKGLIAQRYPVIVTISRLEPRKGIDSVIHSLPELRKQHPNIVYIVGGGGGDRDRLGALASSLGVANSIVFLGRISEEFKTALLVSADLFAMPVRRVGNSVEGFGISYIEAAWFGVPSLGGRDCGATDAVLENETGLLCDGADQKSVTKALEHLLNDASWLRKLGENAQTRVRRDLLWSSVLPRYLAVINNINKK